MFFIMALSGILSTMNVWVDKISDIRFSINDLYMILLMGGWMLLFTGIYFNDIYITIIGFILVVINIYCIRTQFLISEYQYKLGMIPHHSMAVHMSKKLLEKEHTIGKLLHSIIESQEREIVLLKK